MDATNIPLIGALIERLRKRTDHDAVAAATAARGDITKMHGYAELKQCLGRLAAIEAGSGSLGRPLRAARAAHDALLANRPAIVAAFSSGGSEGMRLAFVNAAMALWHTVTMVCAECVEVDASGQSPLFTVIPEGVAKLSASVPVTRLERFAESAGKFGFSETVTESAPLIEREALLAEALGVAAGIVAAGAASVLAVVFVARDLAEYFFRIRGSIGKWLEAQAKFLELNAAALGSPEMRAPRARQMEYAAQFRAMAARLRVDADDAERSARREIAQPVQPTQQPAGPAGSIV